MNIEKKIVYFVGIIISLIFGTTMLFSTNVANNAVSDVTTKTNQAINNSGINNIGNMQWTNTPSKKNAFIPNGLLTDIDYSAFWDEWGIEGHIRKCGVNNLNDGLFGFDSHMIEPAYISETVRDKWRLEFIQITLGIGDKYKNLLEEGVSRPKSGNHGGMLYHHIFEFPLLGMIFQGNTHGAFCFNSGSVGVIYMSELDPTAKIDVYRYKLMPFAIEMMTEQGVVNAIAACVASTSYNALSGEQKRASGAGKALMSVVDTFFYANGCKGMLPIGSNVNHVDPLAFAYNATAGNMHFLSTTTPLLKQTILSPVNQWNEKLYCKPSYGPNMLSLTQYPAQLVRPRVGKLMELGLPPMEQTDFKNDGTTADNAVLLVWERRDFASFAYKCEKPERN